MALFNDKLRHDELIAPFIKKVKAELALVGSIVGQYTGIAATFATLPTTDSDGSALNAGDWSILSADDGTDEAGIYVCDAAGVWSLAQIIPNMNEMLEAVLATDTEAADVAETEKAMTVKQSHDTFSALAGLNTQLHACLGAEAATDDAVNANQFAAAVATDAEVVTIWDAQ